MKRKSIQLLIVGDQNVGKSTFINAIYSQLSLNNKKKLQKVVLPPQMCLYSKQIFTELIDTTVDVEPQQIEHADIILLIYDVSNPETIYRIDSEWLPRITAIRQNVPIILVGNKIDVKEFEFESQNQYVKVKDILRKVTKRYRNVEMGIQCSAFYDRNVKSVLNCAQRAVLYPLSPLYNLQTKQITNKFKKALIRIFRILDKDADGRLYDTELNNLQQRVFQRELNTQDIKTIKQIIIQQLKVQQSDYIQLSGFIALQKKCIQMLKIQICWSILRYFDYNDQLRIVVKSEHFSLEGDQTVELGNQVTDFLMKIYHYAQNNIEIQQPDEQVQQNLNPLITQIFSSAAQIRLPEFQVQCEISQQYFIMNWNLYAFISPNECYEDLLYIGYEKSIQETFVKKNSKKMYTDFLRLKQAKVVSVLIIENNRYKEFIDGVFHGSEQIAMENGHSYCRTTHLYTSPEQSKILMYFKVSIRDLEYLFKCEQTQFSRRINVLIDFDGQEPRTADPRTLIPKTMLYRKISVEQATQILNAFEPPKLDLSLIPIQYQKAYHRPLHKLVVTAIHQFEMYLTVQKINELKEQQQKQNNMKLIKTGVAFICVVGLSTFLLRKYDVKSLWKF